MARDVTMFHSFPTFESVEEERTHRKQRLAASFRLFGRFGFSEGVAGHITARDPEFPETFWVNPFGMHFSHISVSDLIRVDHQGDVVEGDHEVNRAAFCIHAAVHVESPLAAEMVGRVVEAFRVSPDAARVRLLKLDFLTTERRAPTLFG